MSGNEKNKKWFIVMAAVIVSFAFAEAARADWLERQKLLASDGAMWNLFGTSVSISGDYVIVGNGDDYKSDYPGSAYIFRRVGANWVQQQKLIASDGAAGDYFGCSVSISGDYAIVGAYLDDEESNYNSGSAYIFKWNGASWVQQQKLIASDGATSDYFGHSVSISGDYAIVGARYDDNGKGSAYIFRRDGESWVQQQKLVASDGAADDYFGTSVFISDDHAIVGASQDDDNGDYSGSAYIFGRDGASWVQQQKLTASDGAEGDDFGCSVSISGDYVVTGAALDDGYKGSAYIFKRNGTNWSQQQKLTASDGAAYDLFGISVSISGDYAIMGAVCDDGYKGSGYIFRREGENWVQQQKLSASDGAAWDEFGYSVSIGGDYAIVGARFDKDNGYDSGSAYIFNKFCPRADLNDDCKVDFADFAIFSDWWLYGTD